MLSKHKRVLWLLNHRTLMPYECPLLINLGFEVFTPKVIPTKGFRSGLVDHAYDSSLTIPRAALDALNEFDFYLSDWPPHITAIVNRYFGTVFTIPHGRQFDQVVENFEGQIVFRAFGLDATRTYDDVLAELYGTSMRRKLAGIADRFWFGEGYDNLHEIEQPLFVERSLFLPIGCPDSLWTNAGMWRGTNKSILFLCPNAVTDPYYSKMYRRFKEDFGDLPHVIFGAQDVPVDDPNVIGFVTEEQLEELYLDCAVLLYPSTEPRHVHYTPIEAAIKGMPVVFFKDSLLDRMSHGTAAGAVSSTHEARTLLEQLLSDDVELIDGIRSGQQGISYHFSNAYCSEVWKSQISTRGLLTALAPSSRALSLATELRRTILRPVAKGRTKVDPHRYARRPVRTKFPASRAAETFGSTLFDGIDFTDRDFPPFVDEVGGVGATEMWGRWSIDDKVTISLKYALEGRFRLFFHAFGYGPNAGSRLRVKIGTQTRTLDLSGSIDDGQGAFLRFDLRKPCNIIELDVPAPVIPPNDTRRIGVGLVKIQQSALVTLDEGAARARLGCSSSDGIDFSADELPAFVDAIEGMSASERWGRWSTGKTVRIELKHNLNGPFRLHIRGLGYGPNGGAVVTVRIGRQKRTWHAPCDVDATSGSTLAFDLPDPTNIIELSVPVPVRPPNDNRTLGIGLISMRTSLPVTATEAEARARLGAGLSDGIDFRADPLPAFVEDYDGLSWAEEFGRWAVGKRITISLLHVLVGKFRLFVDAMPFGPNVGGTMTITIGAQRRTLHLAAHGEDRRGTFVHFDLAEPASEIWLSVPHVVRPPNDTRAIGFGLTAISLVAPVTCSEDDTHRAHRTTLLDGVDFSAQQLPDCIESFSGLGMAESWGRWSTGKEIVIELAHTLSGRFRLALQAHGYGPNIGSMVAVEIGGQTRSELLPAAADADMMLDFDLALPCNRITISVARPISPPGDPRTVGVGLHHLRTLGTVAS